jgi:hypothetical protein
LSSVWKYLPEILNKAQLKPKILAVGYNFAIQSKLKAPNCKGFYFLIEESQLLN